MLYQKGDWKAWLAIGVALLSIVWVKHYESVTLKMEDRLLDVENFSEDIFLNVQKINCQNMYDARLCEEDYIVVPPYNAVEDVIIDVIKEQEGFRSHGYRDGCDERKDGVCTKPRYSIGYGTREKTRGEIISENEATVRLKEHLRNHVFPYIPDTVTDKGTYIALADIGYNAGPRAISACVNFDGTLNVEEYQEWTKWKGKRSDVLERRRKSVLIYSLSVGE